MNSKPTHPKITPLLAGVAGEYFVAAELSRRGHIASISLRNTRGIDILATNAAASRSVTIQCKTNQLSRTSWVLNEKCESFVSEHHFYAFVVLGGPLEQPRFHIVPSAVLAAFVRHDHQTWLAKPGKYGQAHADTPVRQFHDPANEYLERWELLDL